MRYADYLAVENWEVLDMKVFHYYNDDESNFVAVCVKIGTLTSYNNSITGAKLEKTDIVRWISNGEYQRLKRNSGVIVF